jgi:ATP-binding cassette, subfamily B, bacterial PglK
MMLVLALLETAGVASIMPFLAVLGNPELVETNPALAWAYERGGFPSVSRFLFALGVGSFVLVVASAASGSSPPTPSTCWTQMRRYSIGARLLQVYLRQPYAFFLNRNSGELSKRDPLGGGRAGEQGPAIPASACWPTAWWDWFWWCSWWRWTRCWRG